VVGGGFWGLVFFCWFFRVLVSVLVRGGDVFVVRGFFCVGGWGLGCFGFGGVCLWGWGGYLWKSKPLLLSKEELPERMHK